MQETSPPSSDSVTNVSEPPGAPPGRGALWSVYLAVFLDLLGFGIILPFLPYQALALDVEAGGLEVGHLLASYSLAQLFGAALLGRLSDRFGRRPVLLVSLLGASIGMAASGLAGTLVTLIAARAVAGLFAGSVATAQAWVADVTAPDERAKYMGFVGASIGLGFVFGPAIGGLFAGLGLGFREAAFTAAGLALLNFFLAAWKLHEPERHRPRVRLTLTAWGLALGKREVWPVLVATFATMLAFVGMETTFALLGERLYDLDPKSFGWILTYVGVLMILVQGGLIGRLARRFTVRRIAAVGCVLMAGSLAALPFCPRLAWVLVPMGTLALAQGLTSPTLPTLLSQAATDDLQGSILGVGRALAAGARALGPLAAGWLYDQRISAPYVVGALLALVAAAVLTVARDGRSSSSTM